MVTENMELSKIEISTWLPVFPGFYNTLFDSADILERETEEIGNYIKSEKLADCMIKNLYISETLTHFNKEYEKSAAKQCVHIIETELKRLNFVNSMEFENIYSPKEYNFINDSINIEVYFSAENIHNIKQFISNHYEEWKEYLKGTYTSYDGFISNHANYPEADEWEMVIALNDAHNAGAVLEFLCGENNITDEYLYSMCNVEVQLDFDELKKECINKGWYKPEKICLDWFKAIIPRIRNNYHFSRRINPGISRQYILNTPKQTYILAYAKVKPSNNNFVIKQWFKVFFFGKLKEVKK